MLRIVMENIVAKGGGCPPMRCNKVIDYSDVGMYSMMASRTFSIMSMERRVLVLLSMLFHCVGCCKVLYFGLDE
jgi:hypothetical protein